MQLAKTKTSSYKMITKTSKIKECPYCKSGLTETEKDFFPCSCSFQACIDCYKDIINNKGLCPTCHSPLRLDKLNHLYASRKEELAKSEVERLRKKEAAKKTTTVVVAVAPGKKQDNTSTVKTTTYSTTASSDSGKFNLKKMNLTDLFKVRILQRNLVYVIGLAPKIAKSEILDKFEYFGQYGKIQKIIVNKNNTYNTTSINGPSYSAYITFSSDVEASIAILAIDQFDVYERTLRASYGTTKKDETVSNKSVFIDQQKMAIEHLQKHLLEIERSINNQKNAKGILPSLATIRTKVKEHIKKNMQERMENQEIIKARGEESKSILKDQESQKENKSPNKEKIYDDNGFIQSGQPEEKVKTDKIPLKDEAISNHSKNEDLKDEGRGEGFREDDIESDDSSVSRQSTMENDSGSKKETLVEQQENQLQGEMNQKEGNSIETILQGQQAVSSNDEGSDQNKNDAICQKQILRSFLKDSGEDGRTKNILDRINSIEQVIEDLNDSAYHNDFDKRIFETLFENWSNINDKGI